MRRTAAVLLALGIALATSACAHLEALRAQRGEDDEPPALSADPPALLPAPEGLRATSGEYREIPLEWDPVLTGDAGGYLLEWAEQRDGPFAPLRAIEGRGELAHVDRGGEEGKDGLADGESRFYRIRAFDAARRLSAAASQVVVATTAPLPDPPKGLRAYSRQPREVPLSWQASEDPVVAGYVVERSPTPEGPFEGGARLDGRHATAVVDRGLGDLRVFYYRVAARNPAGSVGEPSAAVRAVTKPVPLPPLGLHVAVRRLGMNVLTWEPNVETDLALYRLFRMRQGAEPELVATVAADTTTAADGGVSAGERVAYALVAVDRDGLESQTSQAIEVESEGYSLRASAGPEGVRLTWNPRGEEGFRRARVQRTGWFTRRRSAYSDTGSYLDRDVVPGRRYRYVVVLEGPDGRAAPPSSTVEIRVPQGADIR
jgi:fibronectin type 3 domain-containing protein